MGLIKMPLGKVFYQAIFIISLIALYFGILTFTMKRNVLKVIRIFEEKNALSPSTAITAEELNIRKMGVIDRAIKKKDNRHHALKFLMDGGVVVTTSYTRLYLNKKKMAAYKNKLNFIGRMMIPDIDD